MANFRNADRPPLKLSCNAPPVRFTRTCPSCPMKKQPMV